MKEREIKLEAPPELAIPALDGVGGLRVTSNGARDLHTVYWDTDDVRLARWRCSLRHRRDEGWTLKLAPTRQGALLIRDELSFAGTPRRPPDEALDLVRAFVRGERLGPVTTLRTRRTAFVLRDASGAEVAELADDTVTVHRGRRLEQRFRQLELELRDGASPVWVGAVVARLRAAGAQEALVGEKYLRSLGARPVEAEVTVEPPEPGRPAAAAVRRALAASVARLIAHDPGVRLGSDAEDVHQARVATRRLRSDLRTFRDLADPAWAEPVREELGWIAALLGDVRDRDVQVERLEGELATMEPDDVAAAAPLDDLLRRERSTARERLLEAMASPRYIALLDRLVEVVRDPVFLPPASAPATVVMPSVVGRPWRRLQASVAGLGDHPSDDALHDVRIRAKRARYAAEAAAPIVGAQAAAFASAVAGLQTVLGDLHDAVVAGAWLHAAAARVGAPAAFVAGALSERERRQAEICRARWRGAWDAIDRPRMHGWIEG